MKTAAQRIFGLDLLRTLAIVGVVIGHGKPILGAADTEFPWIPLGDGVDMFFVLSGYLIGGILISEFVVPGKLGLRELFHFLQRRWFRTLPNYYLILGVNVLFAYLGWSMGNLDFFSWKFLCFTQNLNWHFEGFFWESWSLAVEEWFYLTFPLLVLCLSILGFTAWACVSDWGLAGLNNTGPHGLSEILYAYSSATGNNGSAFAGLTANPANGDPHYNVTLGMAMLIGRFLMIVPIMALAGSLVQKKIAPPSAGTFPVSGATFTILLIGTVVLIGALNFLPALALGPIVEHFLTAGGKLF